MMVAIPELDGATGPMVFGGRSGADAVAARRSHVLARHAASHPRARRDAGRARRQAGRRCAARARAERKVAIVLFNFPPNAGTTGTAAFLVGLRLPAQHADGAMQAPRATRSRCPADVDALRERIIDGNARALRRARQRPRPHPGRRPCAPRALAGRDRGAMGPGAGPAAERRRVDLRARRAASATSSSACSPPSATRATRCGCCSRRASRRPTPSRPSTAGCARISAPTPCCISARTARWNSCPASRPACPAACWPDRLIGDLPNFYLYAVNNPSEGTIAKRRAGGDADQLPDAAGRPCRALSRPARPQGLASSAGAGSTPDADAERAELADADPGAGGRASTSRGRAGLDRRRRRPRSSGSAGARARARIHADPARPACGRRAAEREQRVEMLGDAEAAHGAAERAAIEALVAGGRPKRCAGLATIRPGCCASSPTPTACWRGPRDRRHPARARRPLHPPGAGRRPAAHAGRPADGPQPARLRSLPHPQRLRGAGRRAPGASGCSPATPATATRCRRRWRWCCGAPTTSRPRAGRSPRRWR